MIPDAIKKFAEETNGSVTPEMAVEAGATVNDEGELVLTGETIDALNKTVLANQAAERQTS